ncbi:MAG TPA: DUF362 domain-containing protein [Syntrophorhabdaceae bacterium]|nr:DUF362 domain-containing protein [Syntrophorhabdaceae bacterium]
MHRRDFLKLILSTAILSKIPSLVFSSEPSAVAVSEGKDYGDITRAVINALGGMNKFVKKGDVVVVKPNIGWDRRPEYAANTHPVVVRAIVEECLKAGARIVKVFDNTCNDPRRCYENSGIAEALKGIKGVDLRYTENDRFRDVKINGVFLKNWELYDDALKANVFINCPIAKHHGLTGLTLGLKNLMGIMGGNRGYIHREIEEALADLNLFVKSHLVIIDATRILTRHGPQGGSLKDVKILNKVIASRDIVAADAYATTLFNLKPEDISTTVTAYKRGLGEMNLNKIKIIKA